MTLKRNFILLFTLLFCVTLSAQRKKISTKKTTTTVSASGGMTDAQASKIIEFTNKVIDLSNRQVGKWTQYQNLLDKAADRIETIEGYKKNVSVGVPLYSNTSELGEHHFQNFDNFAKTSTASFPERHTIITAIANARGDVGVLQKTSEALSAYFSKGEYKGDEEFIKYLELTDSLESQFAYARASWRVVSSLASNVGDRAEVVVLKKHPLATFIIPMKETLNDTKLMVNEFYAINKQDDPDFTPIEPKIENLKTKIEQRKDLSGKNTTKLSSSRIYEYNNLFKEAEYCLTTMTDFMVELAKDKPDNGKLQDYSKRVNSIYDRMVKTYNDFQ